MTNLPARRGLEPTGLWWAGSSHAWNAWSAAVDMAQGTPTGTDAGAVPAWQQFGSVAVIPVRGPLASGANRVSALQHWSTLEGVRAALEQALRTPTVRSVVLDIDSGGGEVSGAGALAARIAAARTSKPVVGFVGGQALGVAYWLAVATQPLVVSPTASLGSIGVATFGRSRGRRVPAGDSAWIRFEDVTNEIAAEFVAHVARCRRIPRGYVLLGEDGLVVGQAAVRHRMADRIGDLRSLIGELSAAAPRSSTALPRATRASNPPAPVPKVDPVLAQRDEAKRMVAQHLTLTASRVNPSTR